MATGKYMQWLEEGQLERIANWAANGCTDAEIARNMGVSRTSLYKWKKNHVDILNAIKRGRMLSCEAVENALFKRAVGMVEVTETSEENGPDGRKTRTVTKELPPDTGAIIFYLKNRMPEKYSDRRVSEVSVTAPVIALGVEPGRADD